MVEGFNCKWRINLNIGHSYLYDSAKNEMLHHILKSLGSNQLSHIQFKSYIATYFLKFEEWCTVRNNPSTVLKSVTIVLGVSR